MRFWLLWLPFLATAAVAKSGIHTFFHPFMRLKEQPHYEQSCAVNHLRGGGFTVVTNRPQLETSTHQNFLVHGCSTAGLSIGVDEKYLFEREDVTKVWKYLDNTTFGLWLDGGPGIGKSFAVWAWLCRQANQGKNFMWIHLFNKHEFKAVEFKDGTVRELAGEFSPCDGASEVKQLIRTPDIDIVVLDGIALDIPCSEDMISVLFGQHADERIRIGVTSLGRIDAKTEEDYSRRKRVQFVEMGPWTLDEIKRCALCRPFLLTAAKAIGFTEDEIDSIRNVNTLTRSTTQTIEMRIENKYYYAGGSARWMFEDTISEVVWRVKRYRDSLPDIDSLLINKRGIRERHNSNHLVTRIPHSDDYFFASQYVAQYILKLSSSAVLQTAYELGAKFRNPSYLGWVAEFDFVTQLERASKSGKKAMTLFDPNNQRVVIPVPTVITFAWEDIHSLSEQIEKSCWMRPVAWNEAGFDLVLLKQARIEFDWRSRHILHFFQVTRGATHKVDLEHFNDAVNEFQAAVRIKITGVSITFITPNTVVRRNVKVPQAEIKNEGVLSSYFVGSSKRKWVEKEEQFHIDTLGFEASSVHAI